MADKKRVGVYLPITPDEFEPIRKAIKDEGKDIGFEALKCLKNLYAANLIPSGEGIHVGKAKRTEGQS